MNDRIKFNVSNNLNINAEVENLWIEITNVRTPSIIRAVNRHPVYQTSAIEHFSNE